MKRGILILAHYGLGDLIMSLPLLRAVSAWADGQRPVRVLLHSAKHFELLREEGLCISPLYYHPHFSGARGLLRLWSHLIGSTDLVIAIPTVPLKKLLLVRALIGARRSAGEAFPAYRRLLSFSAEKGWTKSIKGMD
jgi:hypothetical protein